MTVGYSSTSHGPARRHSYFRRPSGSSISLGENPSQRTGVCILADDAILPIEGSADMQRLERIGCLSSDILESRLLQDGNWQNRSRQFKSPLSS